MQEFRLKGIKNKALFVFDYFSICSLRKSFRFIDCKVGVTKLLEYIIYKLVCSVSLKHFNLLTPFNGAIGSRTIVRMIQTIQLVDVVCTT